MPEPKRLAELLTMHSFEVAEVKKIGKDYILDIDVLPNRGPDCFSHLGIAREISAITGLICEIPTSTIKEDKNLKAKDFVSVEIKNKEACPRYTARVVTEVKVGSSPKWIQERLKICGLRPINNIVDILNYVMLETGQPLHAFDGEKLEEKKIIVRFAREREKIVTLDEEKYDLNESILVIADAKKPVAIAGIEGGKIPEIDKNTKIVVLESANFNPRVIRRGSRKLDLKTDASWRFEHGIDPNLTEFAINRAAFLIQKIAKGKILKGLIDFYPKKVFSKRIKLDLDYVERLLGIKISLKEIKNILKKLSFKCSENENSSRSVVEVPTFRLDISIPEDLIEEIGRIYGYQKIKAAFPIAALIPPKRNFEIFWEDMAKNILKEVGFTEVYNYSFISEEDRKIFGDPEGKLSVSYGASKNLIEVENPISVEQKYLRPSLIPNLLKNIQKNQRYFSDIKIFELGKTFKKSKIKNQKIEEKKMLTGLLIGNAFYQAKGILDTLLNKLGISNIWYDEYQPTPEESEISIWHPKKCAEIKVNHEEIGFLGEISPKILDEMRIENKVVIFDIDFEKLQKLSSEETIYQPISRYPAAVRDIAFLVPREVKVVEVLNKINAVGGPLVRDVDLFDIYEGEEIPEGKKNLAFHIIYQAEDRTLSSEEIDEVQEKIIKALEEDPEWQVRK
ncbi:MAG: phenylalanine--tRNA ligase subunit beta [Patescibacteria group bacterium]|nr:phenylalanine--tRNA ligase subunit beta [Patescibacteria group bacterium]